VWLDKCGWISVAGLTDSRDEHKRSHRLLQRHDATRFLAAVLVPWYLLLPWYRELLRTFFLFPTVGLRSRDRSHRARPRPDRAGPNCYELPAILNFGMLGSGSAGPGSVSGRDAAGLA
jgi:hypothetical protein